MHSRNEFVSQMRRYVGAKQGDINHKHIVDVYNSNVNLPRGYKLKYTDPWCAATVSAAAIECGYTDIIPCECSCNKMIDLFKIMGCWQENDAHTPKLGDLIFYDWEDSGIGDNIGQADHVGVVSEITGNSITIIEGNKGATHECGYRVMNINGRYIRGFAVPRFDDETEAPTPVPEEARTAITYVVQAGDNLTKIANKFNTTVDNLVDLNKKKHPTLIVNRNYIRAGWELTIR